MPILWQKLKRFLVREREDPDHEEDDLGGANLDFKEIPTIAFRGIIQNFRGMDQMSNEPEGMVQKDKYVLYCNYTASEDNNQLVDFMLNDRIVDGKIHYRVDDDQDDGGQQDHHKVMLTRIRPQTKIRLPDSGGD